MNHAGIAEPQANSTFAFVRDNNPALIACWLRSAGWGVAALAGQGAGKRNGAARLPFNDGIDLRGSCGDLAACGPTTSRLSSRLIATHSCSASSSGNSPATSTDPSAIAEGPESAGGAKLVCVIAAGPAAEVAAACGVVVV